jgi:DNA-directed RNA polymerase subunit RPC12/RpoP
MEYKCLKCGKTWEKGEQDGGPASHGLCPKCLKQSLVRIYRARQLKEGNFDCFGKAKDYCDQWRCSYRQLCMGRKDKEK